MHRAVRQPGREELHPCENQPHRHAQGAGKSGQNARSFSLSPLPWEIFARLKSPPGGGPFALGWRGEGHSCCSEGAGTWSFPCPARPGAPRTAAVATPLRALLACCACCAHPYIPIHPYISMNVPACPRTEQPQGAEPGEHRLPGFVTEKIGREWSEQKPRGLGMGFPCIFRIPLVPHVTLQPCPGAPPAAACAARAGATRCPPGHGSRSSSRGLCRPRIPTGRSPLSSWRLQGENLAGAPFPAIPDLLQTHLEAASLGGRGALHSQSNYMAGLRGNSLRISKLILIF